MNDINRAAELEQFLKERIDNHPYRSFIKDISVNESRSGKSLNVTILPEGEIVSFNSLNVSLESIRNESQWKRKKKDVYGNIKGAKPTASPAFTKKILKEVNGRLNKWRSAHSFDDKMKAVLSSDSISGFLNPKEIRLLHFLSGKESLTAIKSEVTAAKISFEFTGRSFKAIYTVKTGELLFSLRSADALYQKAARVQKHAVILNGISDYLHAKGIKASVSYGGSPGRFLIVFHIGQFDLEETVVVEKSYKRIVSGAYRNARAAAEQREKELVNRLKECPYYGTCIAQAILTTIRDNRERITERQIINLLRGVNIDKEYVFGEYAGKYKLLLPAEIQKAIVTLEVSGLIRKRRVKGQYQNYYFYNITKEGAFFEKLLEDAVLRKNPVTEQEYLLVLKAVRDDIQRLSEKEKENLLQAVVEHPALFLTEPKLVLDCTEQMGSFAEQLLRRQYSRPERRTDKEILKLLLKAASGKGKDLPHNGVTVYLEKTQRERRKKEAAERRDRELFRLVLTEIPKNYVDLYPEARLMHRKFILHTGPTNSGKTHDALEKLMRANNGIYLAPLRLLAYEQYERMNRAECPCSLITGEERYIIDNAEHQSSTIEMLSLKKHYDVAVIDEAQMIADDSRGGAWSTAIMGICAEEIHICAAPEAEKRLIEIITDCGDDYSIVRHKRMTRLLYEKKPFQFPRDVKPGDALVVFSRKNVHAVAAQLRKRHISCSIIYGALPYDVRHRQAELFASGKNDVVVATDAIGMGMNLPIRRVVLMETEKYDGFVRRPLRPEEIRQIAGRAGRYGIYNTGYVTAANGDDRVKAALNSFAEPLSDAVIDFPETLLSIDASILDLIRKWEDIIPAEGWKKESAAHMLQLAKLTEGLNAPKQLSYDFLTIPFEDDNEELLNIWLDTFTNEVLEKQYSIHDQVRSFTADKYAKISTIDALEQQHRVLDLYYNLARKFQPRESTFDFIMEQKRICSEKIMEILETRGFKDKRCRICGKTLPWNHSYNVCISCYMKSHI